MQNLESKTLNIRAKKSLDSYKYLIFLYLQK